MKVVFIQHGSRVRACENGKLFIDGNFNNNIWKRYKSYCDDLTVILRKLPGKFKEEDLKDKYNEIDESLMNLVLVDDIYSPKSNYFNLKIRKKIESVIKREIEKCDKVILRSAGDFYTDLAYKYAKKLNKMFLVEAIGFPFPSFWYHSQVGKILAFPIDYKFKKTVKEAKYVLYVTGDALQQKYPNKYKNIGCSDVEIFETENINSIVNNKVLNVEQTKKIVLGTAAFLNVKWKGQINVIKALNVLKKLGYNNFEYQLVGAGDSQRITKYIKKYGLDENVKIIGALQHDKVYEWLEKIDIYVQPSYQEGLCRAIIEAMSKGCMVVASNVGGNYELIEKKYLYKKHNYKQLAKILAGVTPDEIKKNAINNYKKSQKYCKDILEKRRDKFYKEFVEE